MIFHLSLSELDTLQELGQVTKIPSISASLMTSGKAANMSMPHAYHVHTRKYISITLQYVQAFGKMWILNFSNAT